MQFFKHSYNHRMQTHIFKDTQCCGLSQQLCSIFCDTLDTGNSRCIWQSKTMIWYIVSKSCLFVFLYYKMLLWAFIVFIQPD